MDEVRGDTRGRGKAGTIHTHARRRDTTAAANTHTSIHPKAHRMDEISELHSKRAPPSHPLLCGRRASNLLEPHPPILASNLLAKCPPTPTAQSPPPLSTYVDEEAEADPCAVRVVAPHAAIDGARLDLLDETLLKPQRWALLEPRRGTEEEARKGGRRLHVDEERIGDEEEEEGGGGEAGGGAEGLEEEKREDDERRGGAEDCDGEDGRGVGG